ncbi:MAG: hypothetical protein WC656_01310 [Sulfurimonas sp.]|jgi:hypothetical protein
MANDTIKRTYGKNRNLGDIIYNPQTKTVFCSINLGFFGSKTITLMKRTEDGCYDLIVSKYNSEETIKIGQTFPAKDRDGKIINGLTKATLALLSKYDNEKKKNVSDSSDALYITTHKLKEPISFGDKGFKKVGYITGQFGIEDDIASNNGSSSENSQAPDNAPDYDDDNEEIPF